MSSISFATFDTAIGPCGIAWAEQGVVSMQLPEPTEHLTRARIAQRSPGAIEAVPPPEIQRAIDGIVRLLNGEAYDLSYVTLDMRAIPPMRQRLYAVLRTIPAGETLSYGALAARLGEGCDARDVGEAMGKNPFPIIVPCHRVVGSNGKIGGFSAPGGVATKLRMLNIERAHVGSAPNLFDTLPLSTAPRRR